MVEMDEHEEMEVELTWIPLGMANMKTANRRPLGSAGRLVFSPGLGRLWRLFGFSIFGSCSARFSL